MLATPPDFLNKALTFDSSARHAHPSFAAHVQQPPHAHKNHAKSKTDGYASYSVAPHTLEKSRASKSLSRMKKYNVPLRPHQSAESSKMPT